MKGKGQNYSVGKILIDIRVRKKSDYIAVRKAERAQLNIPAKASRSEFLTNCCHSEQSSTVFRGIIRCNAPFVHVRSKTRNFNFENSTTRATTLGVRYWKK